MRRRRGASILPVVYMRFALPVAPPSPAEVLAADVQADVLLIDVARRRPSAAAWCR